MFSPNDSDRWTWEEWDSGPVAFAVWALLDDGLRVEPFVKHADGNGRLRAAGLNGESWRTWLLELVTRHAKAEESLLAALRERRSGAFPDFADPRVHAALQEHAGGGAILAAWSGKAQTRVALAGCFERWQGTSAPIPPALDDAAEQERFERRHRLYTEFRGTRPRPSALYLHAATYPAVAMVVIHPTSLVFGRPIDLSDDAEEELLRHGVRQLAEGAGSNP